MKWERRAAGRRRSDAPTDFDSMLQALRGGIGEEFEEAVRRPRRQVRTIRWPVPPPTLGTFADHRARPEISFADHRRARELAHGRAIAAKTRIYLDQNYWIYCRDASLGAKGSRSGHHEIWKLLRGLVDDGRVVCVAGSAVVTETRKQRQNGGENLAATASVVDQLSRGAALQPREHRVRDELRQAMRGFFAPATPRMNLKERVWTYPAFVFGDYESDFVTPLLRENAEAARKAFFDYQATLTFADLHRILDLRDEDRDLSDTASLERLAENAAKYANEIEGRSKKARFKRCRTIEAKEPLKDLLPELEEVFLDESQGALFKSEYRPFAVRGLGGVCAWMAVYGALETGVVPWTDVPALHIPATIHAELRTSPWKPKEGDSFDWRHAEEALPYCEYFLTERNLRHLVTLPHVALDEAYGCTVLSKEDEVIAALERLAATTRATGAEVPAHPQERAGSSCP